MGLKSVGYSVVGNGLCGAAVVPGYLGLGFVTVGTKLLAASSWLAEKGKQYKEYSKSLDTAAVTTVEEKPAEQPAVVEKPAEKKEEQVIVVSDTKSSNMIVEDEEEDKNPDAVKLAAALC